MTTVLQASEIFKQFSTTKALVGANLTLERGELLGLLGPNGAGKTTLIRAISGRIRPDSGVITLLGETLNGRIDGARTRLGIIPQEVALSPLLSASENLEVFGRLLLTPEQKWVSRIFDAGIVLRFKK